MSKGLKIILIALFLVAGFIVARVLFLFIRTLDVAVAQPAPLEIDYEETNDFDHDGLSNADESFWNTDPYNPDTDGDGFLDGEEVLSGYDPLNSAEGGNDSLAEKTRLITTNLAVGGSITKGVAGLIAGGLASGDLKREADDTTFARAVDDISLAAIYDTLDVLGNISAESEDLNIIEATKENQQIYIEALSEIIQNDLASIIIKQPQDITKLFVTSRDIFDNPNQIRIKNTFLAHAVKFQEAYLKMQILDIPENWLDSHLSALTLLKKIEMHHRSIALANDDPIKMMIVLSNLQTVYIEIQPILSSIAFQIKSNNLTSPNNSLFEISNTINDF